VFGKVDDQIVATRTQGLDQRPFLAHLAEWAKPLPVAVEQVQLAEIRMQGQHVPCIQVDKGIDFRLRRGRLERADDGGGEQHVAVMAQLDDQHAAQLLHCNAVVGTDAER